MQWENWAIRQRSPIRQRKNKLHLKPPAYHSTSKSLSAAVRKLLVLITVPFFDSCGSLQKRVPSIDVFGSYFPAWLISLVAGIVLTVIAGGVARIVDLRPSGLWGFLLSVSLILIFSILVWFCFFAG
jgi:YtcA family